MPLYSRQHMEQGASRGKDGSSEVSHIMMTSAHAEPVHEEHVPA